MVETRGKELPQPLREKLSVRADSLQVEMETFCNNLQGEVTKVQRALAQMNEAKSQILRLLKSF